MNKINSIARYCLLKQINKAVAIEVIELKEAGRNVLVYCAVAVRRQNGDIVRESEILDADYDQLESWLKTNCTKNVPILFVVNGDKILHKIIDVKEDLSGIDKIKLLVPDVNSDDFYIHSFLLNDNKEFVSLVRKTFIEYTLSTMTAYKQSIIYLAAGPSPFFPLVKLAFKSEIDDIYHVKFRNYSFEFHDVNLEAFNLTPYQRIDNNDILTKPIFFGDEKVESALIMPYACAINFFLDPLLVSKIDIKAIERNRGEYIYRCLGKLFLTITCSFLFLMLVISSVLFSVYNSKYTSLEQKYEFNKQNWESKKAKRMEDELQLKILERNGLTESSRMSFYADELTNSLPESIYLNRLDIHPVNLKTMSDNVEFMTDKITIDGNCYSSLELNDWVNSLKKLSWIKNILIKDFKDNSEMCSFSLVITKMKL